MQLSVPRPISSEAMDDLYGTCAVPLSRAVVRYRREHEVAPGTPAVDDIGLALVIDGAAATSCEVVDLGSGVLKRLDLSRELVVLDWVYEGTHAHFVELAGRPQDAEGVRREGFRLGVSVLERAGFGPLTRPVLLRLGYRDICRDLDPQEGNLVRIGLGGGRVVRVRLDEETCALVLTCAGGCAEPALEVELVRLFGGGSVRRVDHRLPRDRTEYRVRFEVPLSYTGTRDLLRDVRRALGRLSARFEPEHYRSVSRLLEVFGARETLSTVRLREVTNDRGGAELEIASLASVTVH